MGLRNHSEAGGCSADSGTKLSGACGDADPNEKCECLKAEEKYGKGTDENEQSGDIQQAFGCAG